jgi:putative ABC transport system permease protein
MSYQWLKFAAKNTVRNRRRALVTVAIAALGTAAILLAGGFALFTYEGLAQSAARTTGHLIIAKPEQFSREEDVPMQYGMQDVISIKQSILADPDVRQVLPRVDFSGLISNGDKSTVMLVTGIDPDAEFAIKGPFLTITAGKVLDGDQHNYVMLGEGLANSMKAKPGSGLTLLVSTTEGALNAQDVTVQGIFSTGIPDLDKRLVYTDVTTAQKLLVTDKVSSLGVFLNKMQNTEVVQQRLAAKLPGLAIQTWEQQATFYQSVKALYNRIFGALGVIIGIIVIFVVTNAMAMAIIERTREIGTLRALGTLPSQLTWSYALEGMMLGFAGTVIGALFAFAVSMVLLVLNIQMPPPPGRSQTYPLQIQQDPLLYIGTVIAMVLLSLIASAVIARRTVNRSVVESLAHV